jgi:hypothetical protein
MAEERILDAGALRAAGRSAYAYYVACYAVECAVGVEVANQEVARFGVIDRSVEQSPCARRSDRPE